MHKSVKVIATISFDEVFDDIAEQLQDDDDLDLDFYAVREKLEEEFTGFMEIPIEVEFDCETKEITSVVAGR